MKFTKVAFTIILIIVLVTGCADKEPKIIEKPPKPTNQPRYNTPYYRTITENIPISYGLYPKGDLELVPLVLNANDTVSMQFYAVTDFDRFTVQCPSYGNDIGTVKMSIYKWDINLDYTLTGEVLREKLFENFRDNDSLEFTFEPLPEGRVHTRNIRYK